MNNQGYFVELFAGGGFRSQPLTVVNVTRIAKPVEPGSEDDKEGFKAGINQSYEFQVTISPPHLALTNSVVIDPNLEKWMNEGSDAAVQVDPVRHWDSTLGPHTAEFLSLHPEDQEEIEAYRARLLALVAKGVTVGALSYHVVEHDGKKRMFQTIKDAKTGTVSYHAVDEKGNAVDAQHPHDYFEQFSGLYYKGESKQGADHISDSPSVRDNTKLC